MDTLAAMQLAIQEAHKGLGSVAPNPPVGCVILDSRGEILAIGHHAKIGGPHAEVVALAAVGDASRLVGATVVVTLEPCAHFGRTPPCAEALAKLPISKVVYGLVDPNPQVAGRGLEILRSAGKQVEQVAGLEGELEDLAEIFLTNHRHQRPFVAVKVATTLDGQIAEVGGRSQWITGELARQEGHRLRACFDAILVGVKTFLIDNPRLNIRHPEFADKQNVALVVDPDGRGAGDIFGSELWKCHGPESVIWLTRDRIPLPNGVRGWPVIDEQGLLNWSDLGHRSMAAGIGSILIEGGAETIGRALGAGAVDRWYQFLAPALLGSASAVNVLSGYDAGGIAAMPRLSRVRVASFGQDLLITGRLA